MKKKIISNKERISKNSCCPRQTRQYHHPIGNLCKQKMIDQTKNSSCKINEKNRKEANTQRKRHQKTDGQGNENIQIV